MNSSANQASNQFKLFRLKTELEEYVENNKNNPEKIADVAVVKGL